MPIDPITGAMLLYGGSKAIGGITDYFGGEAASKARRRGERRARSDLTAGIGEAKGYQEPIYQTGMGAYQDVAGRYAGGEFSRPDFSYDPQQVFQDPEYQAAMRSGTAALGTSAEATGDLFSTASQQAQQQFGQDLFSRRSDALFDRAAQIETMGREADLTDFNMGMNIAQPGINAGTNLSNLAYSGGQGLADLSMGAGRARAGDMRRRANILGDLGGAALGLGMGYMNSRGSGGGGFAGGAARSAGGL